MDLTDSVLSMLRRKACAALDKAEERKRAHFTCTLCHKTLPLYFKASGLDGLDGLCEPCANTPLRNVTGVYTGSLRDPFHLGGEPASSWDDMVALYEDLQPGVV